MRSLLLGCALALVACDPASEVASEAAPNPSATTAVTAQTATASAAPSSAPNAAPKESAQLHGVAHLAWSPKGRMLAYQGHGLEVLDIGATTIDAKRLCAASSDQAVQWSSDGKRIAARCSSKGGVGMFDVDSGEELTAHQDVFYGRPTFNHDGTSLLITSGDGNVFVYDGRTGKQRTAFHLGGAFEQGMTASASTRWSPTEDLAAVLYDGGVLYLWRGPTAGQRTTVKASGATGIAETVAWHPSGQMLLVTTGSGEAKVFDREGRLMWGIDRSRTGGVTASYRPDGKRVLLVDGEGQVDILRVNTGAVERTLATDASSASYSPDGQWVAWQSKAGVISVLEGSGSGSKVLFSGPDELGFRWGATSARLLITHERKLRVHVRATGKLAYPPISIDESTDIAISADGKVAAFTDGPLRLLNLQSGKLMKVTTKLQGQELVVNAEGALGL